MVRMTFLPLNIGSLATKSSAIGDYGQLGTDSSWKSPAGALWELL